MTPIDSNTFPRQVEEPRTNLLRDANWPPPFYYEAREIAEQRGLPPEDVERVRTELAYRAWRLDCEDFHKHKAQIVGMLLPRVTLTISPDAALNFEPAPLPPEVQATFDMLDAMALQRAEWYGLTLKHPESEIRRD